MSLENTRPTKPVDTRGLRPLNDTEIAAQEAANGLALFGRMVELIESQINEGALRLRPSMLLELNRIALTELDAAGGQYRNQAVSITESQHEPPAHSLVPSMVEDLCEYVNQRSGEGSAIHNAAFVLWRINWIHPFVNGNGRTARAASYVVLCVGLGSLLPGTRILPELISENRRAYWAALEAADRCQRDGRIDVSGVEDLLERLLVQQLQPPQ